jgi:hypothetical protein
MNNNLIDLKKELNFIKFKKFFLLEFTKQLIKNSTHYEVLDLQAMVERERKYKEDVLIRGRKYKKEEVKEKIKEIIKYREKGLSEEKGFVTNAKEIEEGDTERERSIMHSPVGMFEIQNLPQNNPFEKAFQNMRPVERTYENRHFIDPFKKTRLLIPESRFPPHLQYLQPIPVNKDIELGKLNPLVNDSMVKVIECYGPGENLVVSGGMGTKKTGMILEKEEIENIIKKFSEETKIPVQEGIFKVVAGRLIFLAIISEMIGSKFIIKKMSPPEQRVY